MKERLNWWWFFFCVCIVLPALQFFFLKESLPVVLFPFIQDKFINGLYPFLASGASVVLLLLIVLFLKSISKYIIETKNYKLVYVISGIVFVLFYVSQFVITDFLENNPVSTFDDTGIQSQLIISIFQML